MAVFANIIPQVPLACNNPTPCLRDIFLHALFARLALSDNSTVEFQTKYDPATDTIELLIPDKALPIFDQILGTQQAGKFRTFIDWLLRRQEVVDEVTIEVLNNISSTIAGLDVKHSVRVATTAPGILATSFEDGDVIDGVTLNTGDRILIKDQVSAAENGIYIINSFGAPTRAPDADSSAEVTPNIFAFVEEGTVNADNGWVLITNAPISLGTTPLTFTQFSGAGSFNAGDGLVQSGSTIDVVANADGSIIVNPNDIQVGILATDAQHGNRGGGALHDVATTLADGFMSAADKIKLDASGVLTSTAPTTIQPDDAASAGTGTESARADHKHAIVADVAGTISVGDTTAEGVSTSFSRADHQHALLAPGAPANVDKSAASAGVSSNVARADHKHDVNTATAVELTDSTNAEGTATTLARSDHTHAHGNRGGGSLHAVATALTNGFLSAADKAILDALNATGEFVSVFDGLHTTASLTFATVARLVINFDRLPISLTLRWNQAAIPAGGATIRLRNVTDSTDLASLTTGTTGLKSTAITNPGGVKLIYLQHQRDSGAGLSDIEGAVIES